MTYALPSQVASAPQSTGLLNGRVLKRSGCFLGLGASLLLGNLLYAAPAASVELKQSSTPVALTDGTYVYGESPTPGNMGSTYIVLKVEAQNVVGGFYQPSSSFDCFHGEIQGNSLALTVLGAFEEPAYQHMIALETTATVASQGSTVVDTLVPSGFHALPALTEVDYTVLAACQALI